MPADRSALSPEAQRVLDAREAAIAELRLIDGQDRPINDHLVLRLAGARLYADNINLRVIAGEPVSATEVETAQSMIEAARDAVPKPPIKVEVAFVDGIVGICPKCRAHIEGYVAPPKPKEPPPVIEGNF